MAKNSNKNIAIMILMLVVGLVIGGFMGNFFGKYVPALSYGSNFGVSNHTWDLGILKFTIGFMLKVNVFSVLGLVIAYFLYRKL